MTEAEEKVNEFNLRMSMHGRLNRRKAYIDDLFKSLHAKIEAGRIGGEEGRIWLEQFCIGKGLQICAGDFSIGDSLGVDQDLKMLGVDLWTQADRIPADVGPLDYIVTNYFECFPDPLRMLNEWHRLMRRGGILAMVLRDVEAYEEEAGPLVNANRQSCFTIKTIRCYLARAGFEMVQWENYMKELRVAARRG